jgi:DNA-binding MarR family transcriptional regulator
VAEQGVRRRQRRTPGEAPPAAGTSAERRRPEEAGEMQAREASRLEPLIHERTRLGIVGALAANEKLSFAELKDLLKTTDGNISAHTRKLEDAGYIQTTKRFEGRMPRTEYRLTEKGREALRRYLDDMEALIQRLKR